MFSGVSTAGSLQFFGVISATKEAGVAPSSALSIRAVWCGGKELEQQAGNHW
jgi:hypothetical protein